MSDEQPVAATTDTARVIALLRELQEVEVKDVYYVGDLQDAIDAVRLVHSLRGKEPRLENPIKAEFTMLPPPADHRLCRREQLLDLPEGSYLRGLALDWPGMGGPNGKGPRLVWEWSEPVPGQEVRHA